MNEGGAVRVLYIDHVAHLSGAEQSLFDLVVGLAGGPVEPVVVLPEDGPLATQLRAAGVLVRKVSISKRLLETSRTALSNRPFLAIIRLVAFFAATIRLRKIIKEIRPQVIHTNTLKTHLLAIIPARLSRVPLVWHVRDILPGGWLRRAFTLCARFPDRIVVPSRAVAASMGRNPTVYRKLRLIPNGIRVDTFDDRDQGLALRQEAGAGARDPLVGIVGRIAPWKGQDVFVAAAAMLADRHPKARFTIVGTPMFGDDDFQHELASLVYEYGLDGQMHFAGWRSPQEAMAALDVLVHASVQPEPFGRTIVEAMAAGLPVVAAAGGAIQEILPPNAGFIVPPGRPEILADALDSLLADKALRAELGENGRTVANRFFDVRRTLQAIGTLYAEIAREQARWAMKRARRRRARSKAHRSRIAIRRAQPQAQRPLWQADRRPPVLRPDAPETMPAGRPRRRVTEEPVRAVRRTARIDAEDVVRPARPQGERRREVAAARERMPQRGRPLFGQGHPPVAPARRGAPPEGRSGRAPSAMPPAPPPRRVHHVAASDGTHVVRRPPILDDPRLGVEVATPPGVVAPRPTIDLTEPAEAPPRPVTRTRGTPKRPEPQVPVSTAATAPVLDPVEAPSRRGPVPVHAVPDIAQAPLPSKIVAPAPQKVPFKPVYELVKRALDMLVASVVLVAGAPLWLLVAIAIKLDSRGPVLFKGMVWGKDCEPFVYYKFRSMRTDGGDDGHRRFIQDYVRTGAGVAHGDKTVFKYVADVRITRVGRLIRKLSIDEIPQLINVLRGEMSLVGPRPPLQYEFELYDDEAKKRLAVRPGMTGLQQTYARHSASFAEKVEMDLAYIRDRSLRLDCAILLKTIPAAFKGE